MGEAQITVLSANDLPCPIIRESVTVGTTIGRPQDDGRVLQQKPRIGDIKTLRVRTVNDRPYVKQCIYLYYLYNTSKTA